MRLGGETALSRLFTFHYGEIKATSDGRKIINFSAFTFHYGEIKAIPYNPNAAPNSGDLHSTMVRLKRRRRRCVLLRITYLHSTMVRLKQAFFEISGFFNGDLHSTMVRLKRGACDKL